MLSHPGDGVAPKAARLVQGNTPAALWVWEAPRSLPGLPPPPGVQAGRRRWGKRVPDGLPTKWEGLTGALTGAGRRTGASGDRAGQRETTGPGGERPAAQGGPGLSSIRCHRRVGWCPVQSTHGASAQPRWEAWRGRGERREHPHGTPGFPPYTDGAALGRRVVPPEVHVHPETVSSTFFGNRGSETISQDAVVLGAWVLIPRLVSSREEGNLVAGTETQGDGQCRRGRRREGCVTSQGTPRTAGSHLELRERRGTDPPAGAGAP